MPRYRITAPDGRSITVEGAQAPTEQDIAAIFAKVPQQQQETSAQPDPYSVLDNAKYTLRAAGEGATFGLGDLVAGNMDVLASDVAGITHGKDWKERAKAARNLAFHAFVPGASLTSDRFGKGRRAFVREQEAFAQEHPVMNFGGEMLGGLTTGIAGAGKKLATTAGQQGLKALAAEGAREGAKFGAAYGAGSGFTQDPNQLSVTDALQGAAVGIPAGAAFGAVAPVAIAGAVKGGQALGRGIKRIGQILDADMMGTPLPQVASKEAPKAYVDEFGDIKVSKALQRLLDTDEKAVQQAVKEGVPLIDLADQKMLGTASGVRLASPEAEQIFTTYGRERLAGQHPKIVTALKQYFGNKGSHQLLDELNADIQKGAKVLYDRAVYQLDNAGNVLFDNFGRPIGKVLPELEKLNKYELDYVGKVYGTKGLEYEVQGLPQNDMRILNYAKQLMDDDIQRLTNQGHNNQARILAEKRAAFIEKIDNANPEYKKARNFFERGKRAEEALQEGKKALRGERSNLEYDFNRLTPEEKEFYRKGVGNALEEMSNMQASGGNAAHKVFGEETLRRLKQLGIKDIDKLEKFARAESKASSNIQRLLQGSPTAEREMQAAREVAGEGVNVGGMLMAPKRTFKRSVAKAINDQAKKVIKDTSAQDRVEIARLLTDPEYLAKQMSEVNRLRNARTANLARIKAGQGATSVNQALQAENQSGSVLKALGNKIKEEKGFVANPFDKTVNSSNNNQRYFDDASSEEFRKAYQREFEERAGLNKQKVITALNSLGEPVAKTEEGAKNFKKWFGNSKVVDKEGRPLVLADNEQIYVMDGMTNEGFRKYTYQDAHRAPSFDDTPIAERMEYGGDFNLKEIAKGNSPAPEDYFSVNGPRYYGYDTKPGNESLVAIRDILNGNKKKITAYRAVPKDVLSNDMDNGSWITFSKRYAEMHGENRFDGNYKIIKKEVPIENVWWDGNDINEWGFDNGKGRIKDLFVKIENPKYQEKIPASVEEANKLRKQGFDGVITPDGNYFVMGQNQIKSTKNQGTFDPKNPNIYKSLIGGLGISQILKNKENK